MLKKLGIVDFFASVILELRKVDFPSRQKTITYTVIVIIVSVIVGALIGLLDFGLAKLMSYLLSLRN